MKTTTFSMKELKTLSYPLVVVGGGLAGLVAATKSAREGQKVAVISKKKPGRESSTAYSMGRFSVSGTKMTEKEHLEKTLQTGEHINDRELLEKMVEKAPETLECLREELNLNFSPHDMGYMVADGEKPLPGANLMEKIVYKSMEEENIDFFSDYLPLELVEKENKCGGLLALDKNGELILFRSRVLLLATGGFAGAFINTDNPGSMMGEGLILGYRAGCALRDLEFVQFYPLGFREEGLPAFIAPPRYPTTALLYNDSGEDLIKKHLGKGWDINSATISKRGSLSVALEKEWKKEQVWMDLTTCEEKDWQGVNSKPLYDRYNFDFTQQPFRVGPTAHFTVGGISIDSNLNTGIEGLFAAGEVAGGLHGADRMGGNALTEAAMFGLEAGEKMSHYAGDNIGYLFEKDEEISFKNPILSLFIDGRFNLPPTLADIDYREFLDELKELYWQGLNPIRTERSLAKSFEKLELYRKKILPPESLDKEETIDLDSIDKLKKLISIEMASSLLEICIKSAELRKETRGGHYRKDFPKTDVSYNKNIYWQQGRYFFRDS